MDPNHIVHNSLSSFVILLPSLCGNLELCPFHDPDNSILATELTPKANRNLCAALSLA